LRRTPAVPRAGEATYCERKVESATGGKGRKRKKTNLAGVNVDKDTDEKVEEGDKNLAGGNSLGEVAGVPGKEKV
jgi:hypothetical protein